MDGRHFIKGAFPQHLPIPGCIHASRLSAVVRHSVGSKFKIVSNMATVQPSGLIWSDYGECCIMKVSDYRGSTAVVHYSNIIGIS